MHDTVKDVFVVVMTVGCITTRNQAIYDEADEGQARLEELAVYHCLYAPRQSFIKTKVYDFSDRETYQIVVS